MEGACRIALTGSPGTGKTTLALEMQSLGLEVDSVKSLAEEHGFIGDLDPSDGARPIDIEKLSSVLEDKWSFGDSSECFIEGHLSHSLPVDAIIILRCAPIVLEKRLAARGYSAEKIASNVDWEIIGGPWNEIDESVPCLEIDSSTDSASIIFGKISEWISDGFKPMDPDSSIDWITEGERGHV